MKFPVRVVALTAALVMAPTAASAVTVSSTHGYGEQYRVESYNNGAEVAGDLRSNQGYPVYYEGKVNYSEYLCSDEEVGRYTSNTTSRFAVYRGGFVTGGGLSPTCGADSVSSRVSRDISFAPDPSGYWRNY